MPRPTGIPKTGGRKKGIPNKISVATRERIQREADPIGFLIDVANGKAIKAAFPSKDDGTKTGTVQIYPTLDQRIEAAQYLGKKLMPDLKAIEMSGELGVKHEDWVKTLK